jgi:hypothetical protein
LRDQGQMVKKVPLSSRQINGYLTEVVYENFVVLVVHDPDQAIAPTPAP